MRRSFAIVFIAAIGGCANYSRESDNAYCDEGAPYPALESNRVSFQDLVALYLENAEAEHLRVEKQAAGALERRLASGDQVEIEAIFYEELMRRSSGQCLAESQEYSVSEMALYVERNAWKLINSARLSDLPENELNLLIPSVYANLSAKVNLVVLAASCSKKSEPILGAELERIGISCAQ